MALRVNYRGAKVMQQPDDPLTTPRKLGQGTPFDIESGESKLMTATPPPTPPPTLPPTPPVSLLSYYCFFG
mgnify:CR=1 FL=1